MNFIWDIVIKAQNQGIEEQNLFFCPARECSPWYEQSFPVINDNEIEESEIEYNALYRFDALFHDLLRDDFDECLEFQAKLFDAVSHLLVQIDLHHGLSKREYYIRRLLREMENGSFGSSVANHVKAVEQKKRERLSALALTQFQTGSNLLLFRRAVLVLFPDALLYQERPNPKCILLYVGQTRDIRLEHSIQFIEELFLPVNFRLRVFWKHHFGVLGIDAIMQVDKIEIY